MLGYLYVIEGSTLGAQVIIQHLHSQLPTLAGGEQFFRGYGKKTKMMWDSFCNILTQISNVTEQDSIIRSANLTYQLLYQWMLI